MKEVDVRRAIGRSLRKLGYWDITQTDATKTQCERCKKWVMAYPPKGRPDILVMHPRGLNIVVEVKALMPTDTSFAFSEITEEQRNWLNNWTEAKGRGFLGLGVITKHGSATWLEHIYLVPWADWLGVEETLTPIQASIPLDWQRSRFKAVKEGQLDILRLLQDWEMTREDAHIWRLPEGHQATPILII